MATCSLFRNPLQRSPNLHHGTRKTFRWASKNITLTRVCRPHHSGGPAGDSDQRKGEDEEEDQEKKEKIKRSRSLSIESLSGEAEKFGRKLRDSLSPQKKGDWKDVVLMSFSFAVYVYISQKIVCAYCVWISMLKSF